MSVILGVIFRHSTLTEDLSYVSSISEVNVKPVLRSQVLPHKKGPPLKTYWKDNAVVIISSISGSPFNRRSFNINH